MVAILKFGLNHTGHMHGRMDIDILNAEEVKQRLSLIVIVGILSFVGLISNIHVLFVFVTKMRRSTYRVFVLTLAIIDILGCSVSMPFQIVDETHPFTFTLPITCKLFRFVDTQLAIASALMLVVIAMERYRKICTPKHAQVTELRAIHLSIMVLFLACLIASPALAVYGQQTIYFDEFNLTGSECSWDDRITNSVFGYLYYGLELLCIIICMVCIAILYSMVGAAIRRHRKSVGISLAARFDVRSSTGTKLVHRTADGDEITIDRLMDTEDTKLVTFSTFRREKTNRHDDRQDKRISYIAISDNSGEKRSSVTDVNSDEKSEDVDALDVVEGGTTSESTQNTSGDRSEKSETSQALINSGVKPDIVQFQTSDSRNDRLSSASSTNGIANKRQRNLYTIFSHYFRSKSKDVDTLREQRITKLLFCITLTFVVTYSPYIVILVVYAADRDFSENLGATGTVFYLLALRLYLVNNVTNAFYYGFFDLEFRSHLKKFYKGLFEKLRDTGRKVFN